MKLLRRSIFILAAVLITNLAYGQFTKETCASVLSDLDLKSYQKIKIIPTVATDNINSSSIFFEPESFSYDLDEEIITFKDATGLILYVPYAKLQIIKISPKTSKEYSNISIYLSN